MKVLEKSDILRQVSEHLISSQLVKVTLGSYHGDEEDLKNVYIKPVMIKRAYKLSFTYRYQRRDIVKNYGQDEALSLVLRYVENDEFHSVSIFHTTENIFFQYHPKKGWSWRKEKIAEKASRSLEHNKQKDRKLSNPFKQYLKELRLTDEQGIVYKNAQDKWKQINHYIELLSGMLGELPKKDTLRVVDMGAGKGYLTFALYDYLVNGLGRKSDMVGIEYRQDLVDLCNGIAERAKFNGLSFAQGTIEEYAVAKDLDVLIALHACDTATDDAISKGIQHGANLIVVAPCCHKQVRRELERTKAKNELSFMTKYGVFMERHAEMLTDAIRALILEYYGYQTKVLEFVSDAHTPKNVMIVGVRKSINEKKQEEILSELQLLKNYFGVGYQHLERLMKLG